MIKRYATALFLFAALLPASEANAQALLDRLATLLTEQKPTPAPFVPDPAAAAATTGTVAGLLQVELATLPISSSSGGFVYRLNRNLGVIERASDVFGPFFTERTLQTGREQTSLGVSHQFSSFTSLQGADLTAGTFPTNASRIAGTSQPFSVDTLQLELKTHTTNFFINYGVSDRLAVGGFLPIVSVSFSGERVRTTNGVATMQSIQSGSATGLGDIGGAARYLLKGDGNRGFSAGADLRLPTGSQTNLLGAGRAALRLQGIGSWEDGQLAVHANGGVGFGGASREYFWSTATTFAATPRVTVVGEIMGRWLAELGHVQDVYQATPLVGNIETMRWLGADRGIHTAFIVTGAKWNVFQSWLLNTNLLIRITDAGLRARVTPAFSLDYAFE